MTTKGQEFIHIMTTHGYAIRQVLDWEDRQLEVVREDGNMLEFIPNPSEAVQLEAVKEWGPAIRLIPNPSEAVQLAAVESGSYMLHYIADPCAAALSRAAEIDEELEREQEDSAYTYLVTK